MRLRDIPLLVDPLINFGVRQLFTFKQLSLSFVAATISVGVAQANAVQAAVVGGRVSGTWTGNFTQTGGLNIGDSFTADYTYDDSQVVTNDYSDPAVGTDIQTSVNLLSLIVRSGGTIFQTFNSLYTSSLYGYYSRDLSGANESLTFNISASDFGYPIANYFSAYSKTTKTNGLYSPTSSASASFRDFNAGGVESGAKASSGVTFSGAFPSAAPASSVPTPALLPGLIGMGAGLLRKRQQTSVK